MLHCNGASPARLYHRGKRSQSFSARVVGARRGGGGAIQEPLASLPTRSTNGIAVPISAGRRTYGSGRGVRTEEVGFLGAIGVPAPADGSSRRRSAIFFSGLDCSLLDSVFPLVVQ